MKKDPALKHLSQVREELAKCAKCGECRSVCPVFAERRREKYVARGKLALSEAVHSKALPLSDEFYEAINDCLLCLSCVENCAGDVRVDKIVTAARADLAEHRGLPLVKRIIFRTLAAGRELMNLAAKGGRAGQYLLFKKIPKTSGLRRRFPLPLVDRTRFVPALARRPFRETVPEVLEAPKPRGSVVFFTGCAANYIYPPIAEAAVRVLHKLGVSVIIPKEQACCGAPAQAGGDVETFTTLARKNVGTLLARGDRVKIVTVCSSGGYMLKKQYPDIPDMDDRWRAKAEQIAARTCDISEYLIKEIGPAEIARHITRPIASKVTYHDPCHLSRGQGLREEPRALLELACGDHFNEMVDPARCCGSGGAYGLTHRETSNRILSRKIDNILDSGAQIAATGCPGCIIQLLDGLHQREADVEVSHTIQILARSMGLAGKNHF